jgi:acyl carrier protein
MNKLRQIVADVLLVAPEEVRASTSFRDFPQWDSAAHIDIILSLEDEYGVTFTPEEMISMASVGALGELLRNKGVPIE